METDFVPVKVLFEEIFKDAGLKIPYYQRGYRWRRSEVEALLSDINKEPDGYCLQPIVLKGPTIVDGQQRLTTITLIRKYLELDDSVARDLLETGRSNIDKFFIKENRKAIEEAFNPEKHIGNVIYDKKVFKEKLNKCRFILCRLDENENEEDVFMRLNAGKIPLSSAEILKSYYLTEENCKKDCNRFRAKWLYIEKALQNDDFYYFFSHDEKNKSERYYSSRMDFLLEIYLINKEIIEKERGEDRWEREFDKRYEASPIFAFTAIQEKHILAYNLIDSLENILQGMKLIYDDTELYNLYGFVSCTFSDSLLLLSEMSTNYQNAVISILKNKARVIVGTTDKESLGNLDFYNQNQKVKIKNILLLHNAIRSTERGIRFDYNAYRNDNYDLEHIHARAELKHKKDLQEFCEEVIKEYKGKNEECLAEFLEEFKVFCDSYKEEDSQELNKLELWEDCIWVLDCKGRVEKVTDDSSSIIGWRYILLNGEVDNPADSWRFTSIRNLCLLSASVNRSIGNRSFADKRRRVTEEFLKGAQLPVTTAEIFSVFISNENYNTAGASVWGRSLGDKYLDDIDKTIGGYLK